MSILWTAYTSEPTAQAIRHSGRWPAQLASTRCQSPTREISSLLYRLKRSAPAAVETAARPSGRRYTPWMRPRKFCCTSDSCQNTLIWGRLQLHEERRQKADIGACVGPCLRSACQLSSPAPRVSAPILPRAPSFEPRATHPVRGAPAPIRVPPIRFCGPPAPIRVPRIRSGAFPFPGENPKPYCLRDKETLKIHEIPNCDVPYRGFHMLGLSHLETKTWMPEPAAFFILPLAMQAAGTMKNAALHFRVTQISARFCFILYSKGSLLRVARTCSLCGLTATGLAFYQGLIYIDILKYIQNSELQFLTKDLQKFTKEK